MAFKLERASKMTKDKKSTIITISGILLSLIIGGAAGTIVAFSLSKKGVDYSQVHVTENDQESLYEDYINNPRDPLTYKPFELANIAFYKYSLNEYTRSEVKSSAVAMGVTQTTNGQNFKNKDIYFSESVSSSTFVKVAKRFYIQDDKVDIYNGKLINNKNGLGGEYSTSEEMTVDEYKDTWGKDLNNPVIYTITSETTLDSSSISKTDDGYLISLDLDPLKSVTRYVKQMMQMSNLSDSPEFDYVHLEFSLDSELNLLEMNVKEAYYVWVVGKNYTEAKLTEKFMVMDESTPIPSVDEVVYY